MLFCVERKSWVFFVSDHNEIIVFTKVMQFWRLTDTVDSMQNSHEAGPGEYGLHMEDVDSILLR